jgi:hypothetical protein
MDIHPVAALNLFEERTLFPLAFSFKAGTDRLALFGCPRLSRFLHIVHVPYLLSAFPNMYVSVKVREGFTMKP